MAFTLVTYNIRRGGWGREEALASVIAASNADVVVLQEATSPDVVSRLATGAGFGVDIRFTSRLSPGRLADALPGAYT